MLKVQKILNQVFMRATCSNIYAIRCNFLCCMLHNIVGCDTWGWIAFMGLTKNVDEENS